MHGQKSDDSRKDVSLRHLPSTRESDAKSLFCSGDLLYERIAVQIMTLSKDHFRNRPIRDEALASLTLVAGIHFVSFPGLSWLFFLS
jgi:hypothetical protein